MKPLNSAAIRRPAEALLLGRIIAFAVAAVGLAFLLPDLVYAALGGDLTRRYWDYSAAAEALTYFQTGFARRELVGTLAHLISSQPMVAAAIFHWLAYLCLLAIGVALITQSPSSPVRRLSLGVVFLAVLIRLSIDVGRTDAEVMICAVLVAVSAKQGRWPTTAALLGVALAIHETGFIVLAPLVGLIAYQQGSWRTLRGPRAAIALGVLGIVAVLYALSFRNGPAAQAAAREVHAQFANPIWPDLALYFTLSGSRGLKTAICEIRADPAYPLQLACALAVITLFVFGLIGRNRLVVLAATVAWMVGLSMIATDVGRWATFAVFSTFVIAALYDGLPGAVIPITTPMVLLTLLAVGMMTAQLTRRAVFAPIPAVDAYIVAHGLAALPPPEAVSRCDPMWRRSIGL